MTTLRPLLTTTVLLTLLFAACIGLIHAQPYDDSDLRAFLTPPEGCLAPCFMGIRPGVTTPEEAIAILEAHEWIKDVAIGYNESTESLEGLDWNWSGLQPHWLREADSFNGYAASITIRDGVVLEINMPSQLALGDIWATWGAPAVGGAYNAAPGLFYVNIYPDAGFWVVRGITLNCPYIRGLWYSQVSVIISQDEHIWFSNERRSSHTNSFGGSVVELQRTRCDTES